MRQSFQLKFIHQSSMFLPGLQSSSLSVAYSNSEILVPFSASHGLSISCTKSMFLLAYPLFLPNHGFPSISSSMFTEIVDKYFGTVHFPGIFMYLLLLTHLIPQYVVAWAHIRFDVSFLLLSSPPFFWLRLELFTILPFFHQTPNSESWLHTARLRALLLSLVGLSLLSLPP